MTEAAGGQRVPSFAVEDPGADGAARLRREWWLVAAALAAFGFLLGAGGWTWRVDQTLYDAGIALTARPPSDDIVIVAIDDESLAAIGRWPWPRTVHATLIDRIADAGARAIGIDLLFVEADADAQNDAALAAAIRRAGNVVLPVAFRTSAGRVAEMLPIEPLREVARLGHVDAELDADSILRATYLRAGLGAPTRPHFALALLQAGGEAPALPPVVQRAPVRAADVRAWQRDERVLIRYAGPPGTVPRIPYVRLLRGDVAPDALKGKYVLIGATAVGIGDAFATPVSGRERPMPGIEITANLLNALREGQMLRPLGPAGVGVAAAALALVLLLAMVRLRPRDALIASAGTAVLVPVASLVLLEAGIWIAPAALVIVALIAYPLWSWRRLEAALRFFDRELARLERDDGAPAAAPESVAGARARGDFLARRIGTIRAAAERMRAAQRLVGDTLAALPEAVLVTDVDGGVELANQRAVALAGVAHEGDLRGRALADVLAAIAPEEVPTWPALLDKSRSAHATVVSEARSPSLGDFLVRCAPLRDAAGSVAGFVVALADVTRLKAAERQRDDVLGFVSHDIRSPQASLLSLVQLRRAGQMPMSEDALLEHVETLATRSLELADEFVQVARAEAKPLALADVDADTLLDAALAEIAPQAQHKRVELARGPAADAPPLRVEEALVQRALVNLLNNAVKFSPAGTTVSSRVEMHDRECVFVVEDAGPGIAGEDIARLFERYHRAESGSMLRLQPGIGLGLVFVDAVARRHGGRVTVESTVGAGSRFELWIPVAVTDEGASEER